MKILLSGPMLTEALRQSTGMRFEGAPQGSAQTPVVSLAAELHRMGHDIHLVTLDPAVAETRSFSEPRFKLTFCPLRAPPRYRTRVRALDLFAKEIACLEEVMRDAAPDIVHAHWTYEYAEAAVRSPYPHVVTMHDLGWPVLWQFRDAYRLVRLLMKLRVMPRVKHLTVVAPFMANKAWHYGYLGPVSVIPNGLEVPPLERTTIEQKAGGPPVLAIVGDAGRLKNVKKGIKAFRMIRERCPAAELHLFGPGLTAQFTRGEEAVVPHGQVGHEELMDFLRDRASLLIHPSLLETFGMIVGEAKARGVPVVAGQASGGVPFVCGQKAGCHLVDVSDAGEIAEAALAALAPPDEYRANAERAHKDIEERFESRNIALCYRAKYDDVLEASSVSNISFRRK